MNIEDVDLTLDKSHLANTPIRRYAFSIKRQTHGRIIMELWRENPEDQESGEVKGWTKIESVTQKEKYKKNWRGKKE